MRFTITPEGRNLLPVVQRLPNEPVGRLEGYNGVGKTLATSVLQICSGQQPLLTTDQQARWEGLRSGLGCLRVTVDDLADGRSIEWRLDSEMWPTDLAKAIEITDAWFDIRIDGKKGDLAHVRQLLSVRRIAGNVGLLETLAVEADSERGRVEAFDARISGRLEALEGLVGGLASFLRPLELGLYEKQSQRSQDARLKRDEALAMLAAANDRIKDTQAAIVLREQLGELERTGPQLEEDLRVLALEVSTRQQRTTEILAEIRSLTPAAAKSAEATRSLQTANAALKRTNARLASTSEILATAAARAGLEDPTHAERELEKVEGEIAGYESRRRELTSRPEMLDLLTRFDQPLFFAQNNDLGSQIILIDPITAGRSWTVNEVYDGIGERRESLQATPLSPAVEEVEEVLERLGNRTLALKNVPRLREDVDKAREKLRRSSERVKELLEQAENPGRDRIESLQNELDSINNELIGLGGDQARLERRREDLAAGATSDELRARLSLKLQTVGLKEDALDGALDEHMAALSDVQARYAKADEDARRESAELAGVHEQINRLVVGLQERTEFQWLAEGNPNLVPALDSAFESKLTRVEMLARLVRAADSRLEQLRQTPLSVVDALGVLARELRGGREDTTPQHLAAMRRWLETRAAAWFKEPSVREFVLPEADDGVTVDLLTRRVLGHRDDGSPIAKPLEGFSSGEQAFAFTQAQLALLDHEQAQHAKQRLVVLDEFGAFIADRGRRQLAAQLRQWAQAHPHDQIMVILPATQDYASLALSATDERRRSLEEHAAALADHEYFIAPFDEP
jgi:hypothetical protein